jgi:hypothetical protein
MRATVGAVYDRALEFGHLPNDWRGQTPFLVQGGEYASCDDTHVRLGHDFPTKCEIQDANTFLLTLHLVEIALSLWELLGESGYAADPHPALRATFSQMEKDSPADLPCSKYVSELTKCSTKESKMSSP